MTHYCFDIDGTICTNTFGEYARAEPLDEAIEHVNRLFLRGHEITLFTARGTTTGIDWRGETEAQLKRWGVLHHRLILGKPNADYYIDDRAVSATDWHETWNLPETPVS